MSSEITTRIIQDNEFLQKVPKNTVEILQKLVIYLDQQLNRDWDIYVYPFMNGDRPDLVLFNPHVGIQFIEIIEGKYQDYSFEEKPYSGQKRYVSSSLKQLG